MSRYYKSAGGRVHGYYELVMSCDQCGHEEHEDSNYNQFDWTTTDDSEGNEHHYCLECTETDDEVRQWVREFHEEDDRRCMAETNLS